jgi:hypothetical protein
MSLIAGCSICPPGKKRKSLKPDEGLTVENKMDPREKPRFSTQIYKSTCVDE